MKTLLPAYARNLRQSSTPSESTLWHLLRARRFCSYKFKRQSIIGPYIVDFVCHQRKLIIELDGSQHLAAVEYDKNRSAYLNKRGYKVLRFWNNEVLEHRDAVLQVILSALQSK